jgi:GntR family transcriptional regulator
MSKPPQQAPSFVSDEVPLYYQLGAILREQVITGRYGPGDQLPTEAQLVAEYGVSRITVRQALKRLEEEGLVRRVAGRGTFVRVDLPPRDTLQMKGSLDDLISMGLATSVRLLDLQEVAANDRDAEAFGIPLGAPMKRCTRLRYFHDRPYSYIVNRLPKAVADSFKDHDWEKGSILQFLEERLGIRLGDAEQSVEATLADVTLARLLETEIGAPLLVVDRVVRTVDGEAVERVRTWYRGDIYSLKVHLTRDPKRIRQADEWTLKEEKD